MAFLYSASMAALQLIAFPFYKDMTVLEVPHTSSDAANPIASLYPTDISGSLNGTTLVIPISLVEARKLIPDEYGILQDAYMTLLPTFPRGMYPLMVTAVHDHDIQIPAYNLNPPDFTRAGFEFPFLDILGDGYSSFRMGSVMMISADNENAITGTAGYGIKVYPSVFDPPYDAYKVLPDGSRYFKASSEMSTDDNKFLTLRLQPSPEVVPFPIDFIKNITNQPTFGNTSSCDNFIRLFNTSNTAAPNIPEPVKGSLSANLDPFLDVHNWDGVFGWQFATAFVEPVFPGQCSDFKGYSGADERSGDV